jgi:hypothetical protein
VFAAESSALQGFEDKQNFGIMTFDGIRSLEERAFLWVE